MRIVGRPAAAFAAAALLCACRGEASVAQGAAAAPAPPAVHVAPASRPAAPSLLWLGARRINILCQVSTSSGNDPALERALCERVRGIAATGAPIPIAVASAPDGATLGGDSVVLLVHASAEGVAGRPLLAFTIRPFRQSAGDGAALFGTAPHAVPLDGSGMNGPAVEAGLRAALAEILPWIADGTDPRPL
jgi:hypothetical protein